MDPAGEKTVSTTPTRAGPELDPEAGLPEDEGMQSSASDGSDLRKPAHHNRDGAFDGSFAGTARRKTQVYVRPWYRRRDYFTEGWTDASIWRAATVEAFATALLVYLTGQFGITLMSYGVTQILGYVGIWNTVLLSVFIYAAAPASGGHLNPTITWATMLTGLCPAPRGVLYLIFQTLGGALAGGLLRGSWGTERAVSHMGGGCVFDPATISPGQVFITEVVSSWAILFLGFGAGLDPRQALVFGPQLGPLLVGLSLGVVSSATTGTAPGYTGASANPARCFGLAVARGSFPNHWVWWVGPAVAGICHSIMYHFAPPYHAEVKPQER
ncbi:Aquaporin-like protein [Pleurostoma richardsiae]|uniref:Aquaporin-like protein n=1 Tax=Pleurostoma richardsiae TaxID=41990 RepID=A0AA38R3P0_9PEZI|nr:Aquaporin-like protein [Pleurostoma richardsiae]